MNKDLIYKTNENIIYIDFEREKRRNEFKEILQRSRERVHYFSEHNTYTEEQQEQLNKDYIRMIELEQEIKEKDKNFRKGE